MLRSPANAELLAGSVAQLRAGGRDLGASPHLATPTYATQIDKNETCRSVVRPAPATLAIVTLTATVIL